MSARVTCITDRIRARLAKPLTEPERARKLVAERLVEAGAESARIRQAQARVERAVLAGFRVERCVERAIAWALNAIDEPTITAPSARPPSLDPSDPQPPRAA